MTEDFQKKFHFHSYQPNNETNTSKASTERTKIEKTSDLNFAQFRLFFGGIRLQPRTKHSGVSLNFAKLRTLSFLFTRSISSAGKPNDLICTFFTPPNVHSEWNFFNETSMQPFFGCDEAIVKTRTRIFFSSTEFPMFLSSAWISWDCVGGKDENSCFLRHSNGLLCTIAYSFH